jgi:integrase
MAEAKTQLRFTDLWAQNVKLTKGGQITYWDTQQPGLTLVVGTRSKTFRSRFKLNGTWITRSLGSYGEIKPKDEGEDGILAWAREQARNDRILAAKGIDPRESKQAAQPEKTKPTYEAVVTKFIEHYAKPRQRTWDQTERILKGTEKKPHPWLKRSFDEITKQDARARLRGFIVAGHVYKANVARAWLKKLFRWAAENDYVETSVMEAVSIEFEKRKRERVYTDDEIKATWAAANRLDPAEAAYVKLLMLLAPRKTSLACIVRKDLDKDATLWTVPFDLTKSRKTSSEERIYIVPLPPLTQRLFKGVIKEETKPENRLFPDLPIHTTRSGRRVFSSNELKLRLVELGAPADFQFHAWRHTIATLLKGRGHSKWQRGLVLNHSESGVTADYSHDDDGGYPVELKLKLLTIWAEHVECLVQPQGAALLR